MGCRCIYCHWEGELDDRVPASEEWINEHGVDHDHFSSNGLNCPECGEAQWVLTGADDDFDDFD